MEGDIEDSDVTCQPARQPRSKKGLSPQVKPRQQKSKTHTRREKMTGTAGGKGAVATTKKEKMTESAGVKRAGAPTKRKKTGSAGSKRAEAQRVSAGIKREKSHSPLGTSRRSARLRDLKNKQLVQL